MITTLGQKITLFTDDTYHLSLFSVEVGGLPQYSVCTMQDNQNKGLANSLWDKNVIF